MSEEEQIELADVSKAAADTHSRGERNSPIWLLDNHIGEAKLFPKRLDPCPPS
jgi:hypothetical protein